MFVIDKLLMKPPLRFFHVGDRRLLARFHAQSRGRGRMNRIRERVLTSEPIPLETLRLHAVVKKNKHSSHPPKCK